MTHEHLTSPLIDEILNKSWQQFMDWKTDTNAHQTLHTIPDDVAQVFVPRRILELAEDPSKVQVIVTDRTESELNPSGIGFIIYEHRNKPITDATQFAAWTQAGRPRDRTDAYNNTSAPEGLDYKHVRYAPLIDKGLLTLNDFVFLEYLIDREKDFPSVANTRNLYDRKELRGQGIGGGFYERVEDVLKELGFQYLTGTIWSPNPRFFAHRRTDFADLPEEIKERLPRAKYEHATQLDPTSRVMVKIL